MKKFLSLLLATMLILSLGVTAFATADPVTQPTGIPAKPTGALDASQPTTFTFDKNWVDQYGKPVEAGYVPQVTLNFDVACISHPNTVTDDNVPKIEVSELAAGPNANRAVTVTVPKYEHVGKYNYTITEQDASAQAQGVVCNKEPIGVQVVVSYEGDVLKKTVTFTTKVDGTEPVQKVDQITNTYEYNQPNPDPDPDPNTPAFRPLVVKKIVTGALGDRNQLFNMSIKFTSDRPVKAPIEAGGVKIEGSNFVKDATGKYVYTHKFQLSHDGTITFTHIPAGVAWEVVESSDHKAEDPTGNNTATGYEVTYTGGTTVTADSVSGTIEKTTAADVKIAPTVTNNKSGEVDTGITLDAIPYVIMLTVAVLGVVLFTVKRKVQD